MDRPEHTPARASHDESARDAEQPAPPRGSAPAAVTVERKHVTAELQFLFIALVLVMMIALAGVPGGPVKDVSDGSDALREGWAARQAATDPDWQPAEPPAETAEPTSEAPGR